MNSKKKNLAVIGSLALMLLMASGNYLIGQVSQLKYNDDDAVTCSGSSCTTDYDGDGDGCCNKYTSSTGNRN